MTQLVRKKKKPTITVTSTAIVPTRASNIEALLYVSNYGSRDIKLQVTMAAMFSVSEVLSMCCNSDFSLFLISTEIEGGEGHVNLSMGELETIFFL